MKQLQRLAIAAAAMIMCCVAVQAQPPSAATAQCTPTFSDCAIPENILLQLPGLAISGDVVVVPNFNANLAAVSDVFRVFNNFVDTGASTGIGYLRSRLFVVLGRSCPDWRGGVVECEKCGDTAGARREDAVTTDAAASLHYLELRTLPLRLE